MEAQFVIPGLGFPVYGYGLFAAIGILLAALWMLPSARRSRMPRGSVCLFLLLGTVLGLLGSRLLFCVFNMDVFTETFENPWLMLKISDGGFSMTGLLLGLFLAGCLSARIAHVTKWQILNLAVPGICLLIMMLRLGERFTDIGIGKALQAEALGRSVPFLFSEETFGILTEYRLKVWLYEAITAGVLFILLAVIYHRDLQSGEPTPGRCALRFAILYGSSQILWESMRDDQHMMLWMAKFGQIGAALLCLAALGVLLHRASSVKKTLYWVLAVLCLGIAALVEFSLDGRITIGHPTHLRDWIILLFCAGGLYLLPRLLEKRIEREKKA